MLLIEILMHGNTKPVRFFHSKGIFYFMKNSLNRLKFNEHNPHRSLTPYQKPGSARIHLLGVGVDDGLPVAVAVKMTSACRYPEGKPV